MSQRHPARIVPLAITALVSAGVALAIFPATPPNDPGFAPDTCPPATTCAGPTGQWNLLSSNDGVFLTTGASGISADRAWQITTGDPGVVIAILDSGVNYDHEDLRNKIWLNRGELPVPAGPCCAAPASDPWDCNADGGFDVRDYACDARVTDSNGDGALDRGDLRVFEDGVDDDGDGYVDDLSGWDADDDDGDEFDHRYFGHGTGRAGILAPETNNGKGVAGVCPLCPLMNVRIDDTFVASTDGVAKGAIFAIDHGARVISMSLGAQSASRMSRGAFDYATAKNVLAVNASANEFSAHQNFQSVFDDVMTIGGVTPNSRNATTTWLQKASFSNYGAHLDVVAPTVMPGADMGMSGGNPDNASYTETASGTSSSTPHAAGVAGLVWSRAHELIGLGTLPVAPLALKDLSAQEVRQIIDSTADDVTPASGTSYEVSVGWDRYTGYGRVNARRAVDRVAAGTIPPEADIDAPDWYTLVDGVVTVRAYANARWASSYGYVLEVGSGVEPLSYTTLQTQGAVGSNPLRSSADRLDNLSATWDTSALANGLYTLRLRVTDNLGNVGEDRMAVWVRHPDPQDHPGFPRVFDGSLESISVALVDLDDDDTLEIVFSDGNGEIHAVREDGTDAPGFPVHTDLPANLPLTHSDAFDGNPANGEVPLSYASVIGGPAVGDLDGDGMQEIIVGAENGRVYCWHGDASPCAGFPVSTDVGTSRDQYPPHAQRPNARGEYVLGTPALGDLDGDGTLEIVVGDLQQKLYVWHTDGTRMAPFPIAVFDPASGGVSDVAPKAVLSSAAIADLDGDGHPEIVIGTTESYSSPSPIPGVGGSGRAYVIETNGTIRPGWPVKPTSISPNAVPIVAEGVGTSPVVADVDGDGQKDVALSVFLGDAAVYRADGSTIATMSGAFGSTGPGSDLDEATPEGGLARASDQPSHFSVGQGAFADLEGDGLIEYMAPSIGNGLLPYAIDAGPRVVFDHLLSVWNARTGAPKPLFPRVIEDWQFVTGPAVGDLDGDGLPEIVETSGGDFVHAFDAAGLEPSGWPKLTGHWQTSVPSIGDLDGDGHVELVQTSRRGTLFVWNTTGATCQPDQWRKFRHDEWNTGTYGTDTRRPARIRDLGVATSGTSVTLHWTATGDDARCGTATAYELRASAAPITRANFAAATPIAIAAPATAGTSESATFTAPAGALFYALRAVDDAGLRGPIATVGALTLRRVRLARPVSNPDKATVKARVAQPPSQLGMPADVTVTLTNGGPPFYAVSVPAASFVSNANGTRFKFRGTIGSATVTLKLAGRTRTDVSLSARNLDLSAATAGALVVTVDVGPLELSAGGTLRATGTRLVYP